MVTAIRRYTVAVFFDFIAQNPQNDYELIAGEIVQVGTLDGGAVLPGFSVPISDLFPKQK